MRHQNNPTESVFAGCHNVELFAVPLRDRKFVYAIVPDWWTKGVELSGVYPMPTPWIYIYYAQWTKEGGDILQRTYEQTAKYQFIGLGVPIGTGVARWGTYTQGFHDQRLGTGRQNFLSRPLIGDISRLMRWALQPEDPLKFRESIAHMARAAHNLLVFETMLEVVWEMFRRCETEGH